MRRYQQDQQIEATVFDRRGDVVLQAIGLPPDVCKIALDAIRRADKLFVDPGEAHEPENADAELRRTLAVIQQRQHVR